MVIVHNVNGMIWAENTLFMPSETKITGIMRKTVRFNWNHLKCDLRRISNFFPPLFMNNISSAHRMNLIGMMIIWCGFDSTMTKKKMMNGFRNGFNAFHCGSYAETVTYMFPLKTSTFVNKFVFLFLCYLMIN